MRSSAASRSDSVEVRPTVNKPGWLFPVQMLFLVGAATAAWLMLRGEVAPRFVVWLLVSAAVLSFIGQAINITWGRRATRRHSRGS